MLQCRIRKVRDVGNERANHLPGRRDTKAPLRSDTPVTAGVRPVAKRREDEPVQRSVPVGRAHFLHRAPAHPFGFGLRLGENDFVQ